MFKVGDWVKCVEDYAFGNMSVPKLLEMGKIYKVIGLSRADNPSSDLILDGVSECWSQLRFVAAEATAPTKPTTPECKCERLSVGHDFDCAWIAHRRSKK